MKLIKKMFFGADKNEGNLESINAFLAKTNPRENLKTILKDVVMIGNN